MNDRELLEKAAKAARHTVVRPSEAGESGLLIDGDGWAPSVWWNPLTNDGDALRLAVYLGILLRTDFVRLLGELLQTMGHAEATRLAIVSIAAKIGELLP